jgi:hypothetical protein
MAQAPRTVQNNPERLRREATGAKVTELSDLSSERLSSLL